MFFLLDKGAALLFYIFLRLADSLGFESFDE